MMRTTVIAMAAILAAYSTGLAHGPKVGANGGVQADAGNYHVEIVAKGAVLDVYLRDQNDKAVNADGHKGTAIFVVEGKAQRLPLTPAGDNRLTGTSPVALPAAIKGAVQIIIPSGGTVQAKF